MGQTADQASLQELLKANSRSFYLTLRMLPGSVGPQVGLAYFLARTTDTIADTEIVPLEKRQQALQLFRDRIRGTSRQPLEFGELARQQGSASERLLLENSEQALAVLESQQKEDKERIREVIEVIVSGQELDLKRFAGASKDKIVALAKAAELDDYTYRVAGCVGEFWTKMCRRHLFPRAKLNDPQLLAQGVRFGKGLQLVNILRDLPADLKQGRCYLPAAELELVGLRPEDLLEPRNEPKLRPVYNRYVALAEEHLAAGWEYTNALPWTSARVRLGCAWAILIGMATLAKLRTGNVLDAAQRIKVSRAEVKGIIWRSVWRYPWPSFWRKQFRAAGRTGGKEKAG